jgi:haloacetate dehalogenase
MFDGFQARSIAVAGSSVFARIGGGGPPLLLLHGFPETHLMWRDVAPLLAGTFTTVCADLRGYGDSACLPSAPDHAPYAKRAMAGDLVALMAALGFDRFMVAGHDRGGRVAYRLTLDHPEAVVRLAVLDVVPTLDAWERADARLALGFWPWSLLAQPAPLPERLIGGDPEAVIEDAASQWGSAEAAMPPGIRAAYAAMLADPARCHAICEEYRAAASLDRDHDAADREAGRRIGCPMLALWSGAGALGSWYEAAGGPLGLWRGWCDDVRGLAIAGGHFFPEEDPAGTAALLAAFFSD